MAGVNPSISLSLDIDINKRDYDLGQSLPRGESKRGGTLTNIASYLLQNGAGLSKSAKVRNTPMLIVTNRATFSFFSIKQ